MYREGPSTYTRYCILGRAATMTSREEMIAQLEQDEKAVRERLERLRKPVTQTEEDLQHILGMLAFYRRNIKVVAELEEAIAEATHTMPTSKLRGMTHSAAVVAIAKFNGGVVR